MEDVSSKVSSAVVNTKSVNTVKLDKNGNIFGDNTDVEGFKKSLEHINYKIKGKTALVLGAGGVLRPRQRDRDTPMKMMMGAVTCFGRRPY